MRVTNIVHCNLYQDVSGIPDSIQFIKAGAKFENPHTAPGYVADELLDLLASSAKDLIDQTKYSEAAQLACILDGIQRADVDDLLPAVREAIQSAQTHLQKYTLPKLERQLRQAQDRFASLSAINQKTAREEVVKLAQTSHRGLTEDVREYRHSHPESSGWER